MPWHFVPLNFLMGLDTTDIEGLGMAIQNLGTKKPA